MIDVLFPIWVAGFVIALVIMGWNNGPGSWRTFITALLWWCALPAWLLMLPWRTGRAMRHAAIRHGYRDHTRCPACGQRVLADEPEKQPTATPLANVATIVESVFDLTQRSRRS